MASFGRLSLPVTAATCSARSGPSTSTALAPSAVSSGASSFRRTTAMLRRPRRLASTMTLWPTPELAAFWITQSPAARSTKFRSISRAVGGLTVSIASCSGSAGGSGKRRAALAIRRWRQLPRPANSSSTRSPALRCVTPGPASRTMPTPSPPAITGSGGGAAPYLPSNCSRSAGLIGEASTSTSTSPSPGRPGSGRSISSATSQGLPNAE